MTGLMNVTAAILAGGLGTRLRPIVNNRPKVLAEVCGRPFLAYLLDHLAASKVRQVVLCTGYLGEQIEQTFGDTFGSLSLIYSREPSPLGTGGALRLALPLLKTHFLLVMNGDSFCDVDLGAFWDWHCAKGAHVSVVLVQQPETARFGRVDTNGNSHVIQFMERGNQQEPGWINAGIYLISRRLLEEVPQKVILSLENDLFPPWVHRGLYAYRSKGQFLDIGIPEAYRVSQQFFQKRARR